jgi:hypothetical protein
MKVKIKIDIVLALADVNYFCLPNIPGLKNVLLFSGWPMAHQVVRTGMRQLRHFLARQ